MSMTGRLDFTDPKPCLLSDSSMWQRCSARHVSRGSCHETRTFSSHPNDVHDEGGSRATETLLPLTLAPDRARQCTARTCRSRK